MNTEREGRPGGGEDDALAGGEFTDELTEGQGQADAESGSTAGTTGWDEGEEESPLQEE